MFGNGMVLGAALTNADTEAKYPLGTVYFDPKTGNAYRYVKAAAALTNDTIAAKESLSYADNAFTVTNDISAGLGVVAPAGVAISAIGEGKYGWIQVSGKAVLVGDGSVAAGEAVVLDSSDGKVDSMAAGEEHEVFAFALEADDTAGNVNCMLRGLL